MLRQVDVRGAGDQIGSRLEGIRPPAAGDVRDAVAGIIADVRQRGDAALVELTARFDGCDISATGVSVSASEIEAAVGRVDVPVYQALEEAGGRIRIYQEELLETIAERLVFERSGAYVESLRRPVSAAGLYAPGGLFTYPSTVLMTVIPAKVAGVGATRLCIPPTDNGAVADLSLAAAHLAGADEVFRIGGAQAIAALAYGTETVGSVDVIAGPGNAYVSEAKRQVFGDVGIDSLAGPSELVVIADNGADPAWVAIDLIAQAEHGPGGMCALVVWNEAVGAKVGAALDVQLERDGRPEVRDAITNGSLIICDTPEQAVEVANYLAPEHLELMVDDPGTLLAEVTTAGAVFIGYDTPTPYGDYVAGPNHVLPTGGAARFESALSVQDFVRRMHAVEMTQLGIETVGQVAEVLAEAEGLGAHAEAIRRRRLAAEARE